MSTLKIHTLSQTASGLSQHFSNAGKTMRSQNKKSKIREKNSYIKLMKNLNFKSYAESRKPGFSA